MKALLSDAALLAVRVFLRIFVFGFAIGAAGQNIDSLRRVVNAPSTTSEAKYRALGTLSDIYAQIKYDLDSAIVFSEMQLSLAREMGSEEKQLESFLLFLADYLIHQAFQV